MPKTSRSEQMDFRGLEIIADEFTGAVNGTVADGSITNAKVASNAAVAATKIQVAAITATNFSFAGGTLQAFCQAIADAIPAA